ncbi:MAG: DNA-directed RNA polymerase subunit omega [Kiritimatiellia bacterium]
MKAHLLEAAKTHIPNVPVLINVVSKRVRQLNAGFRPYVRPESPDEEKVDTALREIAEGKLTAEIDFSSHAESDTTA